MIYHLDDNRRSDERKGEKEEQDTVNGRVRLQLVQAQAGGILGFISVINGPSLNALWNERGMPRPY